MNETNDHRDRADQFASTPAGTRNASKDWTDLLVSLSIQVLTALPLSFFLLYILPKFEQIFREFGSALPVLTQLTIGGARLLTGGFVVLLLVAATTGVGYLLRRLDRRLLWAWTALVSLAVVAVTAVAFAAAVLPLSAMARLIDGTSAAQAAPAGDAARDRTPE